MCIWIIISVGFNLHGNFSIGLVYTHPQATESQALESQKASLAESNLIFDCFIKILNPNFLFVAPSE